MVHPSETTVSGTHRNNSTLQYTRFIQLNKIKEVIRGKTEAVRAEA